jgi:multisite-specific tRNA:(cytosine-C5)-methyltransferase
MGGRSYNKKRKGGGDNRILKRDFKKGKRDNVWQEGKSRKPDERGDYKPYDKNNEKFEEYYKGQKIVPEGEWDTFMECLRTPLPTSFRINGTGKYSEDIRDQIENKLFAKVKEGSQPIDEEGNVVEPPRPVRWYPDRLAWQFNYSRQQLRRLDFLESIHDFRQTSQRVRLHHATGDGVHDPGVLPQHHPGPQGAGHVRRPRE